MTGTVEIFTTEGELMAKNILPAELFIEGEDGEVKEHSVSLWAMIEGTAARYRYTSPDGEAYEGEVREGNGQIDHCITINRVSLLKSDRLDLTIRARSEKES